VRRAVPILGAFVLCFFALTTPASTQGGIIVIRGADSGSHLQLAVSGSQLLVNGYTVAARPSACRPARTYAAATCSLDEASAVVVEMGSSDDKVEALDALPVPLTAYLGGGSDKMIGGGERDTCYPQGSDRNRCIGEGGNDACIAASVNTDCVGGAGDDYCRTGNGSDGCWGGPGEDACLMGDGQDGCHGEGGNDRLYGGPGGDQLYGGRGYDHCDGGPGRGLSHECEAGPRH
jgi:Ca2+-binding RTX toxin-like protein